MKIEIANKEELIEEIAEMVLQKITRRLTRMQAASNFPNDELTTLDVQHYFGVSADTVRMWRLNGFLEYKKRNKRYYYNSEQILTAIAEGKIEVKFGKIKTK